MSAPGVLVTTATRSGPTGVARAVSGQYFTIGLTERGPIGVPVKVNSLADYQRVFGARVTYGAVYDDLALFFEAGGTQAWVLRTTGPAAVVGTVQLLDAATSQVATVRIDALSPGAWSSALTVQVEGDNSPSVRKATVRLNGQIVEQFTGLSSVATFVQRLSSSVYVKATDLGSATAAPLNLPAVGTFALTGGSDDRTNVNAARLEALLPQIKVGYGDGAIAAPGFGPSMHDALIAHAAANRRVAILGAARGATVGDLVSLGNTVSSTHPLTGDAAEIAVPFIQVSDGAGGSRYISAEGYFAAARSKAHETIGPWAPGAGELSISGAVIGVDQEFTRAEHDLLDAARVNPVRLVAGRIRIYGARSLSPDDVNYPSITVRDTLNRIVTEAELRLEPYVLRPIDGRGQLLAEMQGVLVGMLEPMRAAGGLFEATDPVTGEVVDPGYSVDVSRNVNTPDVLARNEVRARIAVRLAPNASLITLTITKVGLTSSV